MRSRFVLALGSAVATLSLYAGCAKTDPAPGELMLAVQTDMHAPKDVDAVGIYVAERDPVTHHDTIIFGFAERVAPDGTVHFPATLAVVGRKNPGATVRVRAVAFRGNQARIVRDAITTIPTDRSALLRLPLRWIDDNGKTSGTFSSDGSIGATSLHPLAGSTIDDGFLQITSGCADDETPLNGGCASATIDSSTLPDYDEALVFGGGTPDGGGVCFDVAKCFGGFHKLDLDLATCSAPAPAQAVFDLAIATPLGDKGDCVGNACYVALDRDTPEGWTLQNGRVVLPAAYCARIQSGDALGVVEDGNVPGCAPKANDAPLCGPASAVGAGTGTNDDAGPISDGGLDGTGLDGDLDGGVDAGPPLPETLVDADTPTQIAQDSNYVYFVSRGGRVDKIAKAGGAVSNVLPGDGGAGTAFRLVVVNGRLLLAEHGVAGITQVSVPSGAALPAIGTFGAVTALAGTPDNDYWTEADGGATAYRREYVLTDGGAGQLSLANSVTDIYVDSNAVTKVDGRALATTDAGVLAYAGYQFSDPSSYGIGSPPTGPGEAPVGGPITEDQTNVYWQVINPGTNGHILVLPRSTVQSAASTTPGIVVASADFRTKGTEPINVPHQIATDYGFPGNSSYLAWTTAADEVYALSLTKTSAPVLVSSGESGARGVVLDKDNVYWTDMTSGHVRRIQRAGVLP